MDRETQLVVAPFAATATSRVASTRPGGPPPVRGATKIRVLHVLPSVTLGGIEEGVLSLLRTLDRDRFSPMLACPPKLIEACGRELAEIDVEVYPLERLVRPSQVFVIAQLVRILRAAAPDIVHTHLFVTSLCVAPVAKLLGVRTVVESCRIREGWRGNISKRYWIDRLVNRLVDANVANSYALRRYLLDVKRFPKDKVVVIRNGRDLSRVLAPPLNEGTALREEFHLSPHDTVAVAPGRLEIQKGHSYLLEALPKVLGGFPDLRLLIVGEGSLRGQLAAQITKLNLQDHVTLTGYRKDVYDLLRLSDLVVLPSLFEGLPLVAIEAGALSKTILATRVDGTPEVVLHGVTGWLVPPANSADLAQAMCRLLGDAELRSRLGKHAQTYIAQEYSFDRLVAETERLYTKLSSQSA